MHDLKEILKFTKELTVLYTEDDPNIQAELSAIFEMYFKKLYVGNDGQEGLNLYSTHHEELDLIISDIQMPNMDGLDMVSNIRETNDTIPVIITTAFNDQEYFLRSITCKVTRYLLKPVEEEALEVTLYDVAKSIVEHKEYLQFKEEAQRKEIKDTQDDAVSKISNVLSTPNIIFQDNRVEFYSSTFAELFEGSDINIDEITPQMNIFNEKEGFFRQLQQYKENPINNKFSRTVDGKEKIFRIEKKEIELKDSTHISEMYLLEDITMEENMFSIF